MFLCVEDQDNEAVNIASSATHIRGMGAAAGRADEQIKTSDRAAILFESNTRIVADFVLRARRVEAHSLTRDPRFHSYLKHESQFGAVSGSDLATMSRVLPSEEVLESAAARVRPLILKGDKVFHAEVMGALGYLIGDTANESVRRVREQLKKEWKAIKHRGREVTAYSLQLNDSDGAPLTGEISDNVLAFAWLYGDVIHADEDRLRETSMLGVQNRYEAAVPLICRIVLLTARTLNFIRQLVEHKFITLPEDVFDAQVLADTSEIKRTVTAWSAPDGTPPTKDGEGFGPEWEQFVVSEGQLFSLLPIPAELA